MEFPTELWLETVSVPKFGRTASIFYDARRGADATWMYAVAMGHVKWNREIGCLPVDGAASANLSEEIAEEKAFPLAYDVESLIEALITRTADCIITSWNRGSERLYGFSATEVIGKSLSFLLF